MDQEAMVQSALDGIDRRIKEPIRAEDLARAANYSTYHFCRLFAAVTGTPVMGYVTRRKLEHALYDLSRGKRILDVAMDYGFETHAGFTKAFKKCFGYPPSLCLRIPARPPERPTIGSVQSERGGMDMNPYIIVMTPFTAAGRTLRQNLPNVRRHADIPAYCFGVHSAEEETAALLEGTSELFGKSKAIKHCEISMCYDVDPDSGTFTYCLGRGIFHPDDLKNIEPDMVRLEINGLYAIFSTPPVPFEQHDQCAQVIQDTWHEILTKWLPNSEFEYDEARKDFEYYDYRDHGHYFKSKRQMDICIPIRQREEARRKSQERGNVLWAEEMKRKALRGK